MPTRTSRTRIRGASDSLTCAGRSACQWCLDWSSSCVNRGVCVYKKTCVLSAYFAVCAICVVIAIASYERRAYARVPLWSRARWLRGSSSIAHGHTLIPPPARVGRQDCEQDHRSERLGAIANYQYAAHQTVGLAEMKVRTPT